MKIAVVNDTHAGARSDSLAFNDYFFKFWDGVFFPYLKEHNIKHVIHLGDMVDRRKYINFVILNSWRKKFVERLRDKKIKLDLIVGNHDVPWRNTNEVNAMTELFGKFENVRIFSDPCEIKYDDLDVLLLPWINSENREASVDLIKKTKAQIVLGHLEIAGFEMERGCVCHEGMARADFDKFDMVISGHFHHKSTDGTIFYLGTQYEITWGDFGSDKGFHVFDTDTRELTFVRNPHKMFHKIVYDDTEKDFDYKKIDISGCSGAYVKIVILNKTNPYIFDRFLEKLYKESPLDITIAEDTNELLTPDEEDANIVAEDTLTILHKYADKINEEIDTDRLKKLLRELYVESMNIEQI